jgi:hypothetical protein
LLLGDVEADLVSIARALHRRTASADRPFVVCDRRRHDSAAVVAARSAQGGSLCVRLRRLPDDFPSAVLMLRDPAAAVQLIVCAKARFDTHPFATLSVPIVVPPIQERASELSRIVDAYALDAIRTLGDGWFFDEDRAWVLQYDAGSLAEIETATLRLVALRQARSIAEAAERLAMSAGALRHWLHKRRRLGEQGTAARPGGPGKGDE